MFWYGYNFLLLYGWFLSYCIAHAIFRQKSYIIVMRVCTKSLRSIVHNVCIVDTHGKRPSSGSLLVFHAELLWGSRGQFVHAKGHVCLMKPHGDCLLEFDYSMNMAHVTL